MYSHHFATEVKVAAAPTELFAVLDDHERLAAHMTSASAMLGGARMRIETDAGGGKAAGSVIRMSGRMLGFSLDLAEAVTERVPPYAKTWETTGTPRLLVVGGYRMGFQIAPEGAASRLRMFIDYDDPPFPWTWLGRLLGPLYARWCTRSMAEGVAAEFAGT